MASRLRIGIDFDNTIITYDDVFRAAAAAGGLIAPGFSGNKQAVRDAIRLLPDGELAWQRLQGQVYGKGIGGAAMVAGVAAFLRRCRAEDCAVVVVSHKTEYGHFDPGRVNLRQAALDWMAGQGLLGGDHGIALADIYFESTRAEKLARIAALSLTHFIDDLEEVLSDPDFPPDVERILFVDGAQPISSSYISCSNWRDIERRVFGGAGPTDGALTEATGIAQALVGDAVEVSRLVTGGRNSRIWRVTSSGRAFALKQYPSRRDDPRDRLSTEVGALRLMERHGIDTVPRVLGVDGERGYALLSWIDGSDVTEIGDADVDAAIVFLTAIHGLRAAPWAVEQPPAAEACVAGREIERQIQGRLARLRDTACDERELIDFIDNSVAPRLTVESPKARHAVTAAGLAFDAELPQEWRSLVPSDFGFHNSLRRPDGSLAFLDFEYFGWDDPVKLTADILLHPGRPLEPPQRRRFRQAATRLYGGDPAFATRLSAYLPLFGLRWVLILLNEFIPERWQRRVLAGETGSWSDVKARQLAHAREFLAGLAAKVEA